MLTAIARGIALFLGGFSLLNLAGDLRFARANANLWWIDFWPLPDVLRIALLAAVGVALLAYGVAPRRHVITTVLLAIAIAAALVNAVRYYVVLARGEIATSFPLPLSLLVAAALLGVLWQSHSFGSQSGGLATALPYFIAASILSSALPITAARRT